MKLLVSIHDVSPAHEERVRALWDVCRAQGITPALLVVPNWHGDWPLDRATRFCAWLRRCAAEGAEIFLHGERHDEVGSVRLPLDHVRAFGNTAAEGEFMLLPREVARERIVRGVATLRYCGLEPIGFVPPAWLGRPGWPRTVSDCGLRFSEDVEFIHLHDRATRLRAPVIRWSARSPWRSLLSTVVARVRLRLDAGASHVRVALHPQDLASDRVRQSIVETLAAARRAHHPWQYATL